MDDNLETKIAEAARLRRAAGAQEVYVFGSVLRMTMRLAGWPKLEGNLGVSVGLSNERMP